MKPAPPVIKTRMNLGPRRQIRRSPRLYAHSLVNVRRRAGESAIVTHESQARDQRIPQRKPRNPTMLEGPRSSSTSTPSATSWNENGALSRAKIERDRSEPGTTDTIRDSNTESRSSRPPARIAVTIPSSAQFPPHCMAGTAGQQRIAATARSDSVVLPVGDRSARRAAAASHAREKRVRPVQPDRRGRADRALQREQSRSSSSTESPPIIASRRPSKGCCAASAARRSWSTRSARSIPRPSPPS